MTRLQIEEFGKLEIIYLEAVRDDDNRRQLELMEVIFHWLKKQMSIGRLSVTVGMHPTAIQALTPIAVTPLQKSEFTYYQMALIVAAGKGDKDGMVECEREMHAWIDLQIQGAIASVIKPEFKIIRPGEN